MLEGKHTVLIVDDERRSLELLQRTLRASYNVLKAQDGSEGLSCLHSQPVAAVIADQRMPGMTGVEFLSRAFLLFPQTQRILLTGYTEVEGLIEAINAGQVFGYLAKPWHPKDLLSMLRRAVETYQLLGEKEGLLRDLTQKNQELQELLEETRRLQGEKVIAERWAALGRLAGMVAHDLRSPLATIQCHAGLLEDLSPAIDRAERSVHCIREQIERMKSYIEELLLFCTPGNPGEAMRTYPVGALLASLQEAFLSRCRKQNVSLATRVTFTGCMWINPSQIYRVLENLFQNALDAVGEGGQILIGADQANEREVLLRVADSGAGVPEEIRSKLFEPFVSCGKSGGTGLGLAIVRKIIHEHGGRVWEEKWELSGACFHLILPLLPPNEKAETRQGKTS